MKTKVGISYVRGLHSLIKQCLSQKLIQMIEVIPETYIYSPGLKEYLIDTLNSFEVPYCFHFVGNSLGSADFDVNSNDVDICRSVVKELKPKWFSDHMTAFKVGGLNLEMNLPYLRTPQTCELIADNIKKIKRNLSVPFLIENVTYTWDFEESCIDHGQFYNSVVQKSGCFMLLDLHNLYVDWKNHKKDPYEFIDSIDLKRVKEIHLAGGESERRIYKDSHSQDISKMVWDLLKYVLKKSNPDLILLEREFNFVQKKKILNDLSRINALCN